MSEVQRLPVIWQNQSLCCVGRSLLLPQQRVLAVADVHLGKADYFQGAGLSVPSGGDAQDLAHLLMLARCTGVKRILVLGDLFHARVAERASLLQLWASSAHERRSFQWIVVAGNHDRHAARQFPDVNWCESWSEGPWCATHEPQNDPVKRDSINLCGHLHPGYRLSGRRSRAGTWPVFWFRPGQIILPAFGCLTGKMRIKKGPGEALVVVHPEGLACVGGGLLTRPGVISEGTANV